MLPSRRYEFVDHVAITRPDGRIVDARAYISRTDVADEPATRQSPLRERLELGCIVEFDVRLDPMEIWFDPSQAEVGELRFAAAPDHVYIGIVRRYVPASGSVTVTILATPKQ